MKERDTQTLEETLAAKMLKSTEEAKEQSRETAWTELEKIIGANVVKEIRRTTYEDFEKQHRERIGKSGLSTGFEILDKYLQFAKEDFITILSMSNHGKSTLMLQFLINILRSKKNIKLDPMCIFITYESSALRIKEKLINLISNSQEKTTAFKYSSSEENNFNYPKKEELTESKKIFEELFQSNRLTVLERQPVENLEGIIEKFKQIYPERTLIVFLDYIQILENSFKSNGWEKIKEISQYLEKIAITKKTLIFAAAQVNENFQAREGRDIYNSSTTSITLINHSHDSLLNNKETKALYKKKIEKDSICTINIIKQKHGEVKYMGDYLLFNGFYFKENPAYGHKKVDIEEEAVETSLGRISDSKTGQQK